VEAIVGVSSLVDADCAAMFAERLDAVVLLALGIAVIVVAQGAMLFFRDGESGARATAVAIAWLLGVGGLLGSSVYLAMLASEGRRQTLAEEGVRGLSLDGVNLVVRYCHGRMAREVRFPLSQASGWAFQVQEGGRGRGPTMRLRFRLEHENGRVEWPEYRAPMPAFGDIATGALGRLAPEVASGIAEVVRTHPRRHLPSGLTPLVGGSIGTVPDR
jgi:hypothetical protein